MVPNSHFFVFFNLPHSPGFNCSFYATRYQIYVSLLLHPVLLPKFQAHTSQLLLPSSVNQLVQDQICFFHEKLFSILPICNYTAPVQVLIFSWKDYYSNALVSLPGPSLLPFQCLFHNLAQLISLNSIFNSIIPLISDSLYLSCLKASDFISFATLTHY